MLTNAFDLQRAVVRLQANFEWNQAKSKHEGVALRTAGGMKSSHILGARALTGSPLNTLLSKRIFCGKSSAWDSTLWPRSRWADDLSLVCLRYFSGNASRDLGCIGWVATASTLPASLPPYSSAASLHFDSAWLQKCRAGFPCLNRC